MTLHTYCLLDTTGTEAPRVCEQWRVIFVSVGGHYVEEQILREDGTWSPPYIATGCEGDVFSTPDWPELVQLLAECQSRS